MLFMISTFLFIIASFCLVAAVLFINRRPVMANILTLFWLICAIAVPIISGLRGEELGYQRGVAEMKSQQRDSNLQPSDISIEVEYNKAPTSMPNEKP